MHLTNYLFIYLVSWVLLLMSLKKYVFSCRLQRKLQLEVERREALCRHLSESESSLEMEEERHYNEQVLGVRQHTVSPVPYNPSPTQSRPLSPGKLNDKQDEWWIL